MPRADRAPSFQWYPADYLADPAVDALTFDEQGRYFRALCMTRLARTPGRAPEDQWRLWMRYTAEEWCEHRDRMSRCFRVQSDGVWIQKRTLNDWHEQRRRYLSAKEAGRLSGVSRRAKAANETRTEGEPTANETPTPSSSSSSSSSSSEKKNTPTPLASPGRLAPAGLVGRPSSNGEPPDFDTWYTAYPRHEARIAAAKAYRQALRKAPASVLLNGARRYAREVEGRDPQMVKQPATWLNGGCWLDEHRNGSPPNPEPKPSEPPEEMQARWKREGILG
jgi:uncharacterized protein YdaU (DUF1376 family)